MGNLYICERPYPLYRTIIKAVQEKGRHDILLGNHVLGMEKMLQPLRASGIFNHVFFFDDVEYRDYYQYGTSNEFSRFPKGLFMLIKKFFLYQKLQRDARGLRLPEGLDITAYDDIYVNDTISSINLYLFSKKQKVVWVEHAKDVFQNKSAGLLYTFAFWLTRQLERIGLCYGLHGTSKYVKAVEVSNNVDLTSLIRHKEIREFSLDKMLSKLSEEEKNNIFEIYTKAYGMDILVKGNVSILLTQPLYATGIVPDIEKQVRIYQKIVEEYLYDADIVLIKPHPRDTVDYKNFIPHGIIIDPVISAEILNMGSKLSFEKAVTIHSTSIDSFVKAKEKIILGEEYVQKYLA